MDKITQDDISPQTGREFTAPLSPKRQRLDCTVTNDHSEKSRFSFPKLLTFQKTISWSSSSSSNALLNNEGFVGAAEREDFQDEKAHEQQQGADLNVTLITEATSSQSNSGHAGSSTESVVTAERLPLLLEEDEQPPVTETDKLGLCRGDERGSLEEASAEAGADEAAHPDYTRLGKSFEDETPGGDSCSGGSDEDERQVQNDVSQIQVVTFSSRNEEVRCQSDCTHEGFCNTRRQFSEVVETNQRRDQLEFHDNIPFSRGEGKSPISYSYYADSTGLYSKPKEEPSGNLAEGRKNEKHELELQICEGENVSTCDEETKGQVNESETFIPSAAEGSILPYDADVVVLKRNIAIEDVSLDDCCGAKEERAAGEIITRARCETADHTTETPMPARISRERVEGDNDSGPFSVIDPAIWSETDKEEKHCNSESSAGEELSPSATACEMEMPLPLSSDITRLQTVSYPDQFIHRSRTRRCNDEDEDFCQSCTEPQARSFTAAEIRDDTSDGGDCQWKPSGGGGGPVNLPPAGDDEIQESRDTVGHELKEQSRCVAFPANLENLKPREVEYSQSEIQRMDEMKEREERCFVKEMENGTFKKVVKSQEKLQLQNELDGEDAAEISTDDYISDRPEGKTHEPDSKSKPPEGEPGNKPECSSERPFGADVSVMDVTVDKREGKDVTNVGEQMNTEGHESAEMLQESVPQQNEPEADMSKVSPGEGISERTEGNKLTTDSENDREHKLSCSSDCQHRAENEDYFLPFASPSTSDAVVPCQRDLSHLQNAYNKIPTALNCSDTFPLLPSAFTLYNSVLKGFDTFEKIQLSPEDDDDDDDDDDDAAGLGNIPVLTSSPRQLLKTPQPQLHQCMPVAENDRHEEEEVEKFECHTENLAPALASSDLTCNEVPNCISAADVTPLGWPEQQPPICESACDSEHVHDESNLQSESPVSTERHVIDGSEFEMKKQFDVVLKELHLFFDVSRNDCESDRGPSSPEQSGDVTEPSDDNASKLKGRLGSPQPGGHTDAPSDDAEEDRCLEMCGGDPVDSRTAVSSDGEQEVPLSTNLCLEASMDAAEKHTEPRETEQKGKMWCPSFGCLPLLEQLSHRPPELPRRLEPLKTCTRPIRVGLSKRSKTKHLHRPHPYK